LPRPTPAARLARASCCRRDRILNVGHGGHSALRRKLIPAIYCHRARNKGDGDAEIYADAGPENTAFVLPGPCSVPSGAYQVESHVGAACGAYTEASAAMRCLSMSRSTSPLFVDAVVDCLSEGRAPTHEETIIVAQRIWSEGAASRSAFSWNSLSVSAPDRLSSMLAAGLALRGSR
jgi:hypothetical protein